MQGVGYSGIRAVYHDRVQPAHVAIDCRCVEGLSQHRETWVVTYLEMIVLATRRDGPQQTLIFEGDRAFAVCPTVSEYFIDP
ncbi:hypothetical protein D3C76_1302710 [compost metagenome]